MGDDAIALLVGGVSSALLGLGVWLRRKRRRGDPKSSFRPRARLRAYLSFQTHKDHSDRPEPLEGDDDPRKGPK